MSKFKLIPNPTFKTKVSIPVHGGASHDIEMEFRHKTRQQFDAFIKDSGRDDEDIVLDIATGWTDVDAEFNRESLTHFFENYAGAAAAIVTAYASELMGVPKEKRLA